MKFVAAIAVALVTFVVFISAAGHDFVNWDDPALLLQNAHIRAIDGDSLAWMWRDSLLGGWQPLGWLLAMIQVAGAGGEPSARVFHMTSIVLHALTAAAVFELCRRLLTLRRPHAPLWPAFAAALVFALHPLRAEPVAWAAAQPYLLAALLAVLSVRAFVEQSVSTGGRRALWYVVALVLGAAAMLSKAIAVPLPIVLIVLCCFPLRRITRISDCWSAAGVRVLIEVLPFLLCAIGTGVMIVWASSQSPPAVSLAEQGTMARLAAMLYALAFPLLRTLAPVDLAPVYPIPKPLNPFAVQYVVSAVAVIGASIVAVILWIRRRPAVPAAWVCFLAIIAPTIGGIQHGGYLTADRYSYLAAIPLCALLAGALVQLSAGARVQIAAALVVSLVVITAMTVRLLPAWTNSETLWQRAMRVDDRNTYAHNNFGLYLHQMLGRPADAIPYYQRTIELDPKHAKAHNNLGGAYRDLQQIPQAIEQFREAVMLDPTLPSAHTNLALSLLELGEFAQAEKAARAAIAAEEAAAKLYNTTPSAEPYDALGIALLRQNRVDDALALYKSLMDRHPDYAAGRHNYATALAMAGRLPVAIQEWEQLIAANPNDVKARLFVAQAYAQTGYPAKARDQVEAVLRIDPGNQVAMQLMQMLKR